ncbi:MAG TPA: SemiSWEET transporter [Methanomicrobiales archaeon]|nr:SemiSWEET transporter [Methanomicrobiales archaeon]
MDSITAVGLAAGLLTTVSFLPQVVKTYSTRSAHDLSYGMLSLFIIGLVLWTWYGLSITSLPIILANIITIGLVSYILLMKVKYR